MNYRTIFALTLIITCSQSLVAQKFSLKQESEHFKVFTQQEDSSIADVLKRVEEIYPQATTHLNYVPSEKATIFIFPSVEKFHQYFDMHQAPAFLTSRVQNGNVYITSPSNPGTYHTYQSIINRLGGTIVRAFISNMPKATALPYWFGTGFGLYEAFNGQIIDLYAQELKAAAIENGFLAFDQLANPAHPLASICAYSLVEFLIQQHGIAVIPALVRDFSKFEQITKLSQEAFYAQWVEHIKKLYT